MADEIQVQITTEVDDTEVQGLEERLQGIQDNGIKLDTDESEAGVEELTEETSTLDDLISAGIGVGSFAALSDEIWQCIDSAGQFEDVIMRANLEAEGAGISTEQMSAAISELGDATGRSATQLREGFIKANARGISDLNSFKNLMKGAGAQATLFGTDIESMADKFTMMAQRDTLMQRQMANTGITFQELAKVMGVSVDEVKDKWKTLDADTRASFLGQAATLNEGKNANEAYKNSWAGLQDQLTRGLEKIKRLFGEIFLPIVKPAINAVITVLSALGNAISSIMSGPLSGFVSIIAIVGTGLVLAVPAVMALSSSMGFLTSSLIPAITASWALISPWLPFIAIGAAVVGVIYAIGAAFGWWNDLGSMIDAIGVGISRLWDAFMGSEAVQQVLAWLNSGISQLWKWVMQLWTALTGAFGGETQGNLDIVNSLIQAFGAVWEAIGPYVMMYLNALGQELQIVGAVILWLVQNVVVPYLQLLWNYWSTVFSILYSVASAVFNGISSIIQGAVALWNGIVSGGMAVWNALQGVWNSAKATVQNLASTISSALSTANNAWNSFKSTVMSVIQPIMDKINELKNAAQGVGDWISGALGMGGVEGTVMTGFNSGRYSTGGTVFNITINGNIDSDARINQLKEDFSAIVNGEITENETVIG